LANKRFLLLYDNGDRTHIGTAERDELLLLGRVRALDSFRFAYIQPKQTFHSFSQLAAIKPQFQPIQPFKRYLPGTFVFEFGEKRSRELMETAEGMAIRLQTA
jgi:hypothetical protein